MVCRSAALLRASLLGSNGHAPASRAAEAASRGAQADCKAHYFSVYVASPAFPQPTPAPEMAGVDPLQARRWMRVRVKFRVRIVMRALAAPPLHALARAHAACHRPPCF